MNRALPLVCVTLLFACVKSRPEEKDAGAGAAPLTQATTSASAGAPSATSTAFSVAQCESLLIDAERKLSSERSRAATDCKTDDDCQLIETSACVPACVDRAVAKKAVAPYMKRRDELRQTSCKLWNDAECPHTTPKPTPQCAPMKAVCKAGHCEVEPIREAGGRNQDVAPKASADAN
jgi:hypothetical protein